MRYLTLVPLFLLILVSPLQAIEPHELYHAEVEVDDQGGQARATGMEQAMSEVLVKVAGTRRVHQNEALTEAIRSASRYVQQYRYRTEPQKNRLLFSVQFDPKGIDQLLQRQGFIVWGATRPATLVWLGVEQDNDRLLVGANEGGAVRDWIMQEATRRALPVKLPLLDLADRSRVRPADIWGGFVETLEEASARYAAQAILIGRIEKASASRWEARWILLYDGERVDWQQQSGGIPELIEGGIGQTTEHLLERFSRRLVSGSGSMRVEVRGITGLKHYQRVADYLSAVHGVTGVQAEQVTGDAVRFILQTRGGSAAIRQVIALGDLLDELPAGETMPIVEEIPAPPGAAGVEQTVDSAASVPVRSPDAIYQLAP